MLIINQFYIIYESLGTRKKLDIWIPQYDLTERNLMQRVSICDSLLKRNNSKPFLKQLITGDEKWMIYDKNVWKIIMVEAWTSPTDRGKARPDLEQSDAMCMVGLERNRPLWAFATG